MSLQLKQYLAVFTAVLWKAWALTDSLMSGFWVTGPQVKDLLNHEKCHSAFSASLRALAVSASSCLLFLAPGFYKRVFWDYTQALVSGWKRGNPTRPPLPPALAGSLVLLFATREPRICRYSGFYWYRYWIHRVLLGSLSCDCSEVKSLTGGIWRDHFRYSFYATLRLLR